MKKYAYAMLIFILVVLFFVLSTINEIEAPYIEYASLPRCENDVVVTDELRLSLIEEASNKIKLGTGESYFDNHFIFKTLDYSLNSCIFVVRYEFTYDELHTEMSISFKAFDQDNYDMIETNTFLRPVGLLVRADEAEAIAKDQNITYDYYNVVIDSQKQTFLYKFYKEAIGEGSTLVLTVDGQSKEIIHVRTVKEFIPIV